MGFWIAVELPDLASPEFSQLNGQPILRLGGQGHRLSGLATEETTGRDCASRPVAQLDDVIPAADPFFHHLTLPGASGLVSRKPG